MAYKPQDSYFKKAKQQGYRSRAAYKLIELQERFHLFRPGDLVVDLGAAPGGWLQVAARYVKPNGKVVGVDLQPIQNLNDAFLSVLQGDVQSEEVQQRIKELIGGRADSVISDLAPRLSGIRDADTARTLELNRVALEVASRLLRPGGALVIKSFVNEELQAFTLELKRHFRSVQRTRPEASRQGSSEFYYYGAGFLPAAG
ncbi:MAG TPA: RlmE family RNA methyltransferase [Candidatus Binatia bacterium]